MWKGVRDGGRLHRVDLHSHAGRCFLAGLPAGHSAVATLGAAAVADAVRSARAAGMTALVLAAVADFAVLRPDPATGLRAHRDFRAGEAYADTQRQLAGIRQAVAEAGAEVATSAADLDRAVGDGRTAVLLGCEGGDFLEGDLGRLEEARAAGLTVLTLVHYRVSDIGDVQTEKPVHDGPEPVRPRGGRRVQPAGHRGRLRPRQLRHDHGRAGGIQPAGDHLARPARPRRGWHSDTGHPRLMSARHAAAVAEAGGLVGAWPCGITSRSLADFGTEIIRLAEAAGPDHVAIGTDLDGNYRPVLTSYDQLDDLTGLLAARGLPTAHIHQILGGNALDFLGRML